jgi:ribose transport system substrate-binding protein
MDGAMTARPQEPADGTLGLAADILSSRRGVLGGSAAMALLLAACRGAGSAGPQGSAPGASHAFGRPLKAGFVNAGLANSWPAQGKATTEQWAKWLGIEVTWYDGGLSVDKQRKAVDDMATKSWDFVAIQAFGIVTFLEPDNVAMAEQVTETIFKAIGGKGNVIMTQGALGHSGARKRAEGFRRTLARYPNVTLLAQDTAEWDVNKTAKLWEDYLVKYPKIDGAFFHSDDMALAASRVIRNAGRQVQMGSVDAMPEAIEAVKDGRLLVSARNSSARIHWGALVIGAMAATGLKNMPKHIQIDGPLVTKDIADGVAFMESHFLL